LWLSVTGGKPTLKLHMAETSMIFMTHALIYA